ncbi:site-specific DNA-methyltransferase [Fusobacterium animalis]|uniref:DNA-methyltransferase n=1 Tax=Fusobacterium animalis TaxID=76859 RepID=UPI0030D038E6
MKKDIKNFINKMILGDCIEVLKKIPNDSIAGCLTDPPYNYEFIGKDWNISEIERRIKRTKKLSTTLIKNIPYGSGLSGGVRNENWYKKNRNNILEYQNWVKDWGNELYRILKPGSYVLIFNSTRTVAHVQVALEEVGFYARDIIVWRRNSGIPKGLNIEKKLQKMGKDNFEVWKGWHSALRNEWEAISVVQKPLDNNYISTLEKYQVGLLKTKNNEFDSFQSNIIENIKRDTKNEYNSHVTVKPLELIEKLLGMIMPKIEGNIIIDPFLGSGTTAVAATKLGIDWIGIDINSEYLEIAKKRVHEEKNNFGKKN